MVYSIYVYLYIYTRRYMVIVLRPRGYNGLSMREIYQKANLG